MVTVGQDADKASGDDVPETDEAVIQKKPRRKPKDKDGGPVRERKRAGAQNQVLQVEMQSKQACKSATPTAGARSCQRSRKQRELIPICTGGSRSC